MFRFSGNAIQVTYTLYFFRCNYNRADIFTYSMLDSDPVRVTKKPDGLINIVIDVVSAIHLKQLMLMFVVFLTLSSNMFIDGPLSQFNRAVYMKVPTTYGTILQGIFLVFACIILQALDAQKII